MSQRDAALLKKLRLQLGNARRLYSKPTPGQSFDERPWRGDDMLIIRAGFNSVETRYLREGEVRRSWAFVFTAKIKPEDLYDWLLSLEKEPR